MKILVIKNFLALFVCLLYNSYTSAQQSVVKAAGPEYQRSGLYKSFFGHNYRREWITPTSYPILMLDTAYGGLTPYKKGGGHQSKSLHLKTKAGKEYVMRTVNKSLRVIIPEIFYKTFIEHIVDDEISMSNPYAAVTVPGMAEAAKIPHTEPKYVFVPEQPALDSFNPEFANKLYIMEQRPDGDWSDADNLGNYSQFISSEKLRKNIFEDNSHEADQLAFVKARLFDMFIGDWDRHEDQWKWAPVEKNNRTVYMPVPVDRDQAYARFDGIVLKPAVKMAARYMQNFEYDIDYPQGFNYERRNIDRLVTNKVTLYEWQGVAKQLEGELTDAVIEQSIHRLPPEIFALSGQEIIAKLKSRREHLGEYATKYYLFIAKNVDIVGSQKREYFKVSRLNDKETEVKIYDLKDGVARNEPFYSRKFNHNETEEIRLYGLSGKDIYSVDGDANRGIKVRIIGGNSEDSLSISGHGRRVQVYDDKNKNVFELHGDGRLRLSSDTMVHSYDYDAFRPDKNLFKPAVGFNSEDRLFAGIEYLWQHHSFKNDPFAFKQTIGGYYSVSQRALSVLYTGIFPKLILGWDVLTRANYDPVRWSNFSGTGNETPFFSKPANYFRLRTAEWLASVGFRRRVGIGYVTLSGFYSNVRVLRDEDKFITATYLPAYPENIRTKHFLGASLQYGLARVNDPVVPTSGIIFKLLANYTRNTSDASKSFSKFGGDVQFFVPLIPKISLAISTGAETVTDDVDFYQYPVIGGGDNLRGFLRDRFRGKTSFYNSNEIRFISNINTYILRGKGGLVAFFDNGRVWMPGEKSNTLHVGYGGGILISPFNVTLLNVTYAVSKETTQVQFRGVLKL